MAKTVSDWRIDCPVTDSFCYFKTLDFLGTCISNIIPISFSGSYFQVLLRCSGSEKIQKDQGVLTASLRYSRLDCPGYQLYWKQKDDEIIRHRDNDARIVFGVDTGTLKTCFAKNTPKDIGSITIFSKYGENNLFYTKDKTPAEYTLKTVIGYVEEQIPPPKLAQDAMPTVTMTVEDFSSMCRAIKERFTNGIATITVHEDGMLVRVCEYATRTNEIKFPFGVKDGKVKATVNNLHSSFFSNFHSHIDKICNPLSVVYFYFNQATPDVPMIMTVVLQIGNSGELILQREG